MSENTRHDKAHGRNTDAVSAEDRDEVMAAAGGRCEYVFESGERCENTEYLQIDHIIPRVWRGSSKRENLRVLCGAHNGHVSERLMGDAARAWRRSKE